ncbi:hypothetical protein MPC38_02895 [Prescottella equi]|uniref:hypothetical protein n=1 Tax=Rhodococcus hoagii TaxID=43767 RepID=UPI001F5B822B|nr:hypothetical protein [Prescottella equi]UNQ40229.1 hypothetical protein MPC38_02895 [Prescottella equi]
MSWLFLGSARVPSEQEQREEFAAYLERLPDYHRLQSKHRATDWWSSDEERFQLYARRWQRPKPPAGLPPIPNLVDFDRN